MLKKGRKRDDYTIRSLYVVPLKMVIKFSYIYKLSATLTTPTLTRVKVQVIAFIISGQGTLQFTFHGWNVTSSRIVLCFPLQVNLTFVTSLFSLQLQSLCIASKQWNVTKPEVKNLGWRYLGRFTISSWWERPKIRQNFPTLHF